MSFQENWLISSPMDSVRKQQVTGRQLCSYMLLLILLASCGWRLRGLGVDVTSLPPAYLGGEDLRFISQLSQAFSKQGFILFDKEHGQWEIKVIKHKFSRRLSAVNQSGQATSFLLSLSIQFKIMKKAGDTEPATQRVIASQDIRYDQTAVLGKDAEEKIIHQSLLGNTVQQIIHRFRAAVKQ